VENYSDDDVFLLLATERERGMLRNPAVSIKEKEILKQEIIERNNASRTVNGYQQRTWTRGKKNDIDKEWDKKLAEHQSEIEAFYAAHPGLGKPKRGRKK